MCSFSFPLNSIHLKCFFFAEMPISEKAKNQLINFSGYPGGLTEEFCWYSFLCKNFFLCGKQKVAFGKIAI